MDIIRSRQNPLIKACIKLAQQRRERMKAGRTLLDGAHLVIAALDVGHPPDQLVVAESAVGRDEISLVTQRVGQAPTVVADALFAELSELDSLSGILAIWPTPPPPGLRERGVVLALDGVQDPGNVGAILRTAAAAGVDQTWLGVGCADVWSPKVLRAGMGAHFVMPVLERVDLPVALARFSGKRAVTLLAQSTPLFETDLSGDLALILGNEGQGVSPAVLACADLRIHIPMQGGIESLNVGAAAAICLFERLRQSDCGAKLPYAGADGAPVDQHCNVT
jgi:TrmH family RNA methyltransferase